MIAALRKLLLQAAWAPVGVLIIHAVVARTSLREPLDFWMHFLGGAAIAYFFHHALGHLEEWVGKLRLPTRHVFSFSLACTTGLFWEFAEEFSDSFLHTHIQKSLKETMSDLIADATGATLALILVAIGEAWRKNRSQS